MPKASLITGFTNTTIFNGENFTSTAGATSGTVNISRFDEILFFANMGVTGAAAMAATITFSASPDGTNFFAYEGLEFAAGTIAATVELATAGSAVFKLRDIGGIHTIRASLTMINQVASSSVSLRYSARTKDI